MGAYHTIDVEPQRKFTLTKPDGWDSVALDRVDEACDAARTADLAAIVMQEGLANICLVTSSMTVQKQKVIAYFVLGSKTEIFPKRVPYGFSPQSCNVFLYIFRSMLPFHVKEEVILNNTRKL